MKKLVFAFFSCLLVLAYAQDSRIAFVTPSGQLATVGADGSDLRILDEGEHRTQFPAWSPDGTKLAAITSNLEGGFIRVLEDRMSAQPNIVYRSSRMPPFYLYWSPDSTKLSLLANAPNGIALHIASENEASYMHSAAAPFYWQWSQDAQTLFVHTGSTGQFAKLGFTNVARDDLSINLANPGLFQAPGISASGEYIAYATTNQKIIIDLHPDTMTSDKREVPYQGVAALSWNPGKELLALMHPIANRPTYYGPIRLIDAETGFLETITDTIAVAFFWSPRGRYLAYFTPTPDESFANNQPDDLRKVSDLTFLQTQSSRFLDLYIYDTETKTEELLASFVPSNQFIGQFLPFFDQYALSHAIWSPDESALVLPVVSEGKAMIATFNLDGSSKLLAEGDMPFWNRR